MPDKVVMCSRNVWPKEEPCAFFFFNSVKVLRNPGRQSGPTIYAFFFARCKFPVAKKLYKNNNYKSYHILNISYLSGTVVSHLCIITHFALQQTHKTISIPVFYFYFLLKYMWHFTLVSCIHHSDLTFEYISKWSPK